MEIIKKMNLTEDKVKKLEGKEDKLKSFYKALETYTTEGKMITDKELNKLGKEWGLI